MIELSHKQVTGNVIRLHPDDNVVVARTDVGLGDNEFVPWQIGIMS